MLLVLGWALPFPRTRGRPERHVEGTATATTAVVSPMTRTPVPRP